MKIGKAVVVFLVFTILYGCGLVHNKSVFFIPADFKYGKLDHSINRKVFRNDSLKIKEILAEYTILSISPDTLILTKLYVNNELTDSIVENIRTKEISRTQFLTFEKATLKGKSQNSIIDQTNTKLVKKEKVNFGNKIILESDSEVLRHPVCDQSQNLMSVVIRKSANWKDMEGNILSSIEGCDSLVYEENLGLKEINYKITYPKKTELKYKLNE
ncbi:MAG: hypothetical protein NVV82_22305 [Sporocytophaga sp.]|nr:hypothetical protein [Sporocytophaga sp.]